MDIPNAVQADMDIPSAVQAYMDIPQAYMDILQAYTDMPSAVQAYMDIQSAILGCRQEVGVIKGGGHRRHPASLAVMGLAFPESSSQHSCSRPSPISALQIVAKAQQRPMQPFRVSGCLHASIRQATICALGLLPRPKASYVCLPDVCMRTC